VARKGDEISRRDRRTDPRLSHALAKPAKPSRSTGAGSARKVPLTGSVASAARAKRTQGSAKATGKSRKRARDAKQREAAESIGKIIEGTLGAVGAALSRLDTVLDRFAEGVSRLDSGLERVSAMAGELASSLKQPPWDTKKLNGHAANIEGKLERLTVDNRRGLELLGLKLDRIVNAVGELRRTISLPSHRPGGGFA
jgi:hypothetical protein